MAVWWFFLIFITIPVGSFWGLRLEKVFGGNRYGGIHMPYRPGAIQEVRERDIPLLRGMLKSISRRGEIGYTPAQVLTHYEGSGPAAGARSISNRAERLIRPLLQNEILTVRRGKYVITDGALREIITAPKGTGKHFPRSEDIRGPTESRIAWAMLTPTEEANLTRLVNRLRSKYRPRW
ncbi:MAG: hypothetical protein ABIG96_03965 [Candidatus Micrarchaeota archaeon]